MRLLLDTHVVLALCGSGSAMLPRALMHRLSREDSDLVVSVASLWEIAIKAQLGKLRLGMELKDFPELLRSMGLAILPIGERHVLETPEPEPETRDPFDRLLLNQCEVEQMALVTIDRALSGHRLALKP